METSVLAGGRLERAAQAGVFGASDPVGRRGHGGAATAAFQFGAGEQFRQFGLIAGRQQREAVEHAADRGPSGGERCALA